MCYPVCGMVHIKISLVTLLIEKSSPCSGGNRFSLSLFVFLLLFPGKVLACSG